MYLRNVSIVRYKENNRPARIKLRKTESQKLRFMESKLTVCLIKHSLRQCNYGSIRNLALEED